jgi:hypothetical protein
MTPIPGAPKTEPAKSRQSSGSPASKLTNATATKHDVKGVLLKKASRDLKLGVRLAARRDGSNEGVEVVDVHPSGPLSSSVQPGDVLLRINGKLCNEGYQQAAEALRDATGVLECAARRHTLTVAASITFLGVPVAGSS